MFDKMKDKKTAFVWGFAAGAMLIAFLAILGGCSDVESQVPETFEATASWDAPTYGTPVEYYIVQHQVETGAWSTVGTTTELSYTWDIPYSANSKARVAGVDAEGRQGPFSLPSAPYNPSETRPGIATNVRFDQ